MVRIENNYRCLYEEYHLVNSKTHNINCFSLNCVFCWQYKGGGFGFVDGTNNGPISLEISTFELESTIKMSANNQINV